MKIKYIIPIILAAIFLSACSPAELFSQFATSDIEQAASQSIEKEQVQKQKLELIEAKKKSFPESVVMSPVAEAAFYQAIVFQNNYTVDQQSILDIEAILPNPDEGNYMVWIKSDSEPAYTKLGVLSQRNVDDYYFTFETVDNISAKPIVVISVDFDNVTQPENIILTGSFNP